MFWLKTDIKGSFSTRVCLTEFSMFHKLKADKKRKEKNIYNRSIGQCHHHLHGEVVILQV